jgi:lysozyme family protein
MSIFDERKKQEIAGCWNACIIDSDKIQSCESNVNRIVKNKARYEAVSLKTNVPWYVIAVIHTMESDCDFNTHLHNGDSLKARTHQVPAGRPLKGNPPFSWEESAIDALEYDHLAENKDWSMARILYLCEAYNGFGYEKHMIPSGYVWSGTNIAKPGRYIADHVWDASAISKRCGCAAMIKMMIKLGVIQNGGIPSDSVPKPLPIPENPRSIVKWVINSNDTNDVRGFDADNKVVCWLDSQSSLEIMYYSAVTAGAPRAKFFIESMDKKPGSTPVPKPEPKPTIPNAKKFVEYYKGNYSKVRAKVEEWFVGKHSPTATKNGCVAHVYSCLWLCSLDRPKVDTMESINVDYFFAWALKNGWSKVTDMSKLQPGDVCVSGPSDKDFDHVYTFLEYVDAKNCYCLDNQKFDSHVRALKDGSCGEWRFAIRMA